MNIPLLSIALVILLSELASFGQARHVTLTLDASDPQTIQRALVTNELHLAEFETAELVSQSRMRDQSINLSAVKDGITVFATTAPVAPGFSEYGYEFHRFAIAGPAKIVFIAPLGNGTCFATFRITPESFPPDRTIIAMPGTNQTSITLECSTNLVQWSPATNGVYGPMPEAKFFRIKAQPVN